MRETRMTRREALAAAGAVGLAGAAGCIGKGDAVGAGGRQDSPSGTLTIGAMQPLSGDLEYYGQQSLWGFYSGLAYKADAEPTQEASTGRKTVEVGDTTFELVVRDSQFSADTAQTVAIDLVQNEDVDMLFGCSSSGAARRVISTVVRQAQVPYVVGPAASAGITSSGETCGENVFRASENTAMDARSGGAYVADETDVSRVFLFGADYEFGRAVVNNYRTVLEDRGVEIVGERFVPRGYAEWEGLLDNAAEAGAEGIVGGFTLVTLPNLFTAFLAGDYDYRVFGGFATRLTNQVVGQTLQQALGTDLTESALADTNLGPFTTRYHWNQYDNEINDRFVETYTNAYGVVPDLFTSGTFTAASAVVQAVRESGSTDGADVAETMRGMTVADTPKGEDGYVFQEYDNQARSSMTVANVVPTTEEWSDSWGAPIMPSQPIATVPGEEATIPADSPEMNCSL